MADKLTVSILGCGWYGLELAKALINKELSVNGSTTSATKLPVLQAANINPYLVNFSDAESFYDTAFFNCDVLWICFPPKIRSGNSSSYLVSIERIINTIKEYSIKQVVFISSTGVYGEVNEKVDELTEPTPDSESGKALLQAERLLQQQTAFTTTIIRFAGLIGPGREPGRFLAGKKNIANGLAPVNLIHLTDCIGISWAIFDKKAFGYTYNACSPNHPTRIDFYTKAALHLGLETPEFVLEKKQWKVINSINIGKILGYEYVVKDLMEYVK